MTRRRLGVVLAVLGVLVAAYAATVVLWRDPATDLYARWKQHELSEDLDEAFAEQEPIIASASLDNDSEGGELSKAERVEVEKLAVARAANPLGARSLTGAGSLPADLAPGGGEDHGDRRTPDDLRGPVPAH